MESMCVMVLRLVTCARGIERGRAHGHGRTAVCPHACRVAHLCARRHAGGWKPAAQCAALMSGMVLGACTNGQASHLVYVHQSNLGVDASIGAQGRAKLALGYDRETFALVPRVEEGRAQGVRGDRGASGANERGEAMSLVSLIAVRADGLSDMHFGHAVATGSVAVDVANDTAALARLRAAVDQLPGNRAAEAGTEAQAKKTNASGGAK